MSLRASPSVGTPIRLPPAARPATQAPDSSNVSRWHPGIVLAAACLAAVNLLSLVMSHQPVLLGAAGLLVLLAVLGYAAYCALPGPPRDPLVIAFLSVCLGVVTLLLIGLVDNTILPRVGVAQPLRHIPVLLTIDLVFVALCRLGRSRWEFMRGSSGAALARLPAEIGRRLGLVLLPAAAAIGAVALDNGRGSAVTLTMLIACLAVMGYVIAKANSLSRATIVTAIYTVALALLLMTSLRGRYTTGHDVQHEYYVFELAHSHWHWSIADLRDPYNACLSITILPVMLAGILHVSDVMIYKFLFQLIFALVPVGVFVISDRLAGRRPAVLAALVFMSFPTYFSDMPMLNRQELAMFQLTGMMLLFVDRWPGVRRTQQAPFLLLGLGVVLSHYSTSYLMVGQFGIAVLLLWLRRVPGLCRRAFSFNPEGRHRFGRITQVRLITVPVVVVLAAFAVIWQSPVTHTGGNISQVAGDVVKSVTGGKVLGAGSGDLSASFLGGAADPAEQTRAYAKAALAARTPGADYFPTSVVNGYPLTPSAQERAPLTALGRAIDKIGASSYSLNSALRGGSAKVMQILLIFGLLGLLIRRPRSWGVRWDPEYQMLCIGGLGIVGAIVALPFLSVDYGLLRAFQQTLVVLSLPVVMGCAMLGSIFGKAGRSALSVGLPAVFFVSSTGIAASATGGYLPQLHLSNSGDNYDAYYTHDAEIGVGNWLATQLPPGIRFPKNVQADYISSSQLAANGDPGAGVLDIAPGLIQRNGFIFLSYSNVVLDRAYALYQATSIPYTYPTAFLDDNKNRVADAGVSRVYR
ncbi:MAG: hypothetical protein JWN96_4064 [Mycobacterium sp.]|nr:hypothetical protein [Mycobacterium sp.]